MSKMAPSGAQGRPSYATSATEQQSFDYDYNSDHSSGGGGGAADHKKMSKQYDSRLLRGGYDVRQLGRYQIDPNGEAGGGSADNYVDDYYSPPSRGVAGGAPGTPRSVGGGAGGVTGNGSWYSGRTTADYDDFHHQMPSSFSDVEEADDYDSRSRYSGGVGPGRYQEHTRSRSMMR